MTTSLIDLTNHRCFEYNILTRSESTYVPHSNINELILTNADTNELISKFHLIKDEWTLVETNYPEFYI